MTDTIFYLWCRLYKCLLELEQDAYAYGITSISIQRAVSLFFSKFIPQYSVLHMPTFDLSRCHPFLARCACVVGLRFDLTQQAQDFSSAQLLSMPEHVNKAFLEIMVCVYLLTDLGFSVDRFRR